MTHFAFNCQVLNTMCSQNGNNKTSLCCSIKYIAQNYVLLILSIQQINMYFIGHL